MRQGPPLYRLVLALRPAAMLAVATALAWFVLPVFSGAYTEGFEATIGINALQLLKGRLEDVDLLYPFNGQFFVVTRLGAAVVLAGLHAVDQFTTVVNFRLLMLASLALLAGSTVAILVRIYRVRPAWAVLTCLLFPPMFESAYFFNDNVLSAGLSTLALLLFWRGRSLPATAAAAILLGLAVATRPDAAFLAPAFAVLMWFELSDWRTRIRHALLAAPIVATIPIGVYAAFGLSYFQIFTVVSRALSLWNNDERLSIYAVHAVHGLALPGMIALPLGLGAFLYRRQWREVCLCVVVPLIYLVAYGRALHELRYLLPLSPFLAIAVAEGGRVVWRSAGRLQAGLSAAFALAFLACLLPAVELPYWRLGTLRADNDGPRPIIGRAWSPLVWLHWLDNLNAGVAVLDGVVEQAGPGTTTVIVSDYWNPDRLVDLILIEHGFAPARTEVPAACRDIAELFRRGSSSVLHVRAHIPFIQSEQVEMNWALGGLPCLQAAGLAGDVVVVGWRAASFAPPGTGRENGVDPLYRAPPPWPWVSAGLSRAAYIVSRAPVDRVPALLTRGMIPESERAARETFERRVTLLR